MSAAASILLATVLLAASVTAEGPAGRITGSPRRIVFLGDSITDAGTYVLLVRQALLGICRPAPICENAGVGGDDCTHMLNRIKSDVLPLRPDLVVVSAGINDVLGRVRVAQFSYQMGEIVRVLRERNIAVIILTTGVLGGAHGEADRRLDSYNAVLRDVAGEYVAPLGDTNRLMKAARTDGVNILEADGIHPNFAGHRIIARAVLDALGYGAAAVPEKLKTVVMPGIITSWSVVPERTRSSVSAPAIAETSPTSSWRKLDLPEREARDSWWLDQERSRGFALDLDRIAGKAKRYLCRATVTSAVDRSACINTGGAVQAIWLNGREVFRSAGWTGWHAGKERILARMRPGANEIVIETGARFFISVTRDNTW